MEEVNLTKKQQKRNRQDTFIEAVQAREYARSLSTAMEQCLERCVEATQKADPKKYYTRLSNYFAYAETLAKEAKKELKKLEKKGKQIIKV